MVQRIHLNTLLDITLMDIIRPLCIKLPQMTGYARKFNENVTILLE